MSSIKKIFAFILAIALIALPYQIALAKSSMYAAIKPPCASPKLGPVPMQQETQADKYMDKFANQIAPSVVGNIIGGPAGLALKIASKFDPKTAEGEEEKSD